MTSYNETLPPTEEEEFDLSVFKSSAVGALLVLVIAIESSIGVP